MHFKSSLCAILLICTSLALAQTTENEIIPEEESFEHTLADPVGFLRIGRGRYLPITSTEYETYARDGEQTRFVAEYATPYPHQKVRATSINQTDIDAILKTHNDYRAAHSSPALVWNDTLANFGDDWIQ
ncbi:hypothetical protein BGZ83_003909, partial [Gryganskiella cystojenkinii]